MSNHSDRRREQRGSEQETTTIVKVQEDRKGRIWFGVSSETAWRIAVGLGLFLAAGGKDFIISANQPTGVTHQQHMELVDMTKNNNEALGRLETVFNYRMGKMDKSVADLTDKVTDMDKSVAKLQQRADDHFWTPTKP